MTHDLNIKCSQYLSISFLFLLSGCANEAEEKDVQEFFSKNKIGRSPDYAFVKNGIGGPTHLITIHGYVDDKSVCEGLAKEYNGDASLSTLPGKYQCIQLNE